MDTDQRAKEAAQTAFAQYLTRHRCRKTPERFAILERVMASTRHFDVDSLFEQLAAEGYPVSKTTVYNTLQLLIDSGLVRRHTFDNRCAQFERVFEVASPHHHLVCVRCGKIKELRDPRLLRELAQRKFAGFHAEYFELCIYGVCSLCQRRMRQSVAVKKATTKKT